MCEIYDVTKVDRGNGNFVKTDNSNNKKTLLKWWDKAMQFIGLKHAASVSSDNDKNNVDNENLQKHNMPKNDNFVLKFLKIKQISSNLFYSMNCFISIKNKLNKQYR